MAHLIVLLCKIQFIALSNARHWDGNSIDLYSKLGSKVQFDKLSIGNQFVNRWCSMKDLLEWTKIEEEHILNEAFNEIRLKFFSYLNCYAAQNVIQFIESDTQCIWIVDEYLMWTLLRLILKAKRS